MGSDPVYRAPTPKRTSGARAEALQRSGRIGTLAASLGQRSVAVAVAAAMSARAAPIDDLLAPA